MRQSPAFAATAAFGAAGSCEHRGPRRDPCAGASAATTAARRVAAVAAYTETIPGTSVSFDMSLPGGTFTMGSHGVRSPAREDEGPGEGEDRAVLMASSKSPGRVRPLCVRQTAGAAAGVTPSGADPVSKPTPPYADESWGFGKEKQPALGMTCTRRRVCRWLSAKTNKTYRLATGRNGNTRRVLERPAVVVGGHARDTGGCRLVRRQQRGKPRLGGQKKPTPSACSTCTET